MLCKHTIEISSFVEFYIQKKLTTSERYTPKKNFLTNLPTYQLTNLPTYQLTNLLLSRLTRSNLNFRR